MDLWMALEPYRAMPDVDVLRSYGTLPGLGMVPISAFVLHAEQPVLVDTGLKWLSDEFMGALSSVIDPADLKWLWLTHSDQDHIGSLARILDAVPGLRVITTYPGVGHMSLFQPLPLDRVYLLNPGQSITVGDRTLTAVRPPNFDAPETTGCYDPKSSALFSADCFGALMSEPAETAADIGPDALREGMVTWATFDSPWLHSVDPVLFGATLDRVRKLRAEHIFSAHLPPAYGMAEQLLGYLAEAPPAKPFVGFEQQALEAMLRGAAGA
jgi:glyoxylase-like metal-dependent hydrolase (beta-lactamase superfamily II)